MSSQPVSRRRRPGRVRRWVLRPVVWFAVLLVVAFAASLIYLDSAAFAERARRVAERRLTAALERQVTIGGLDLDLIPLAIVVSEMSIAGPTADAEPLFSVARATAEADAGAFLGRRLELRHLHLARPRLRIGFDADGRPELPRPAAFGRRGEPFALRFGTLEIVDGELHLGDQRTPVDFAARELAAVFTGVGDGIELRGRALTPDMGLRLPTGRRFDGRLEIHGVIHRHRFDLVRADLAGGDLEARADGYWRWHGDRELRLDLEATGDLAALGRLGYAEGLLSGPVDFAGRVVSGSGAWSVDGVARSPDTVVLERRLTAVETRLRVDEAGVSVAIERATHAGGAVTGAVDVAFDERRGRVDVALDLARVDLGQLLADLDIPVRGLSGAVSGPFTYGFEGDAPEAGDGAANLVVAEKRVADPARLPVVGAVPLVIERGRVRSPALRIAGASFTLDATGVYDIATRSGGYDFEIDAERVADVLRLVPGADATGAAAAWRPTAGRGRATGRLELAPGATALALDLDLAAVAAPGLAADSVSGRVALDGAGVRELRLTALRPGARLAVDGAVPFAEPSPGARTFPFALRLAADSWPLDDAREWLPFELPFAGPYTGVVDLAPAEAVSAPPADAGLGGRIAGRLAPVTWGAVELSELTLEADFDPVELRLARGELGFAGGALAAAGTITWEGRRLDLEFESTPLDLGSLLPAARLAAAGGPEGEGADVAPEFAGRLAGRLRGTADQPDLEVRLAWPASGEAIELEWRGGTVAAAGRVPGLFAFAGGGELTPEAVAVELALTEGRLAGLTALAAPGLGIEGAFAGRLWLTGRLTPEVELATTVSLDSLRPGLRRAAGADVELPKLANLEPVVLAIDGEGVALRSLYLGDEAGGSEVFVGGRIGLDGELDLQLQASIASEWLAVGLDRVWPGARWSDGAFDAIATIGGDLERPRVSGVGEVRGGRLVADALPAAIDDLAATFLFYRDQLVVDSVSARFAGGTVRAGGVVPIGGSGAEPSAEEAPAFRFQAVGEQLNYRSPDGWTARAGGEVTLTGTADGQQITGGVVLDEVVYVKDIKLGLEQLLRALFGAQRLEVAPADGWRAATHLNLRIEGRRALRVRNNLADLRGSADLVLRGTVARPVVFGAVEVEPGGRLRYGGVDYRVERGQLSFTNPYRIEPAIDLSARTELREYDITLDVTGTPDRLALDFASNPPLADLDVLGILAGAPTAAGGTADGIARIDETVSAGTFLYGQATSLIAQRFNRLFGLDKFRIDPLTSATGALSSARVTIGKRLTRNLAVTYSYDASATEEQVLELDWNVSRNLILVLTQNGDGTYAVDALWEKAF